MSKTKTRNEIKAEMETLAEQITQMQGDHAAQIADLEAAASEQTDAFNAAKADNEKLTADIAELTEAKNALEIKLTDAESKLETITAEKAESDEQLAKAKAALANPANLDATIAPTEIDQTAEDAEADKEEENAKVDEGPKDKLEEYEAMSPGKERQDFYHANKSELYRLMDEREQSDES